MCLLKQSDQTLLSQPRVCFDLLCIRGACNRGALLLVESVALVLLVGEFSWWCHDLLRAIVRTRCWAAAAGSSCVWLLARTTAGDFFLLGMDAAHDTGKSRFCV